AMYELRGLLEGVPLLERLPDPDDLLHREDVVVVIAIRGRLHETLLRPIDELTRCDIADARGLGRRKTQTCEHLAVVGDQDLRKRVVRLSLRHRAVAPLTSNSDSECCWRTNHVSMRCTDIETWPLAGGSYRRALDLPVRHLDRGVIPGELRAIEFGPEAADLDSHRCLHFRRLHRREHRRVPALGRVTRRFDETYDDGSGDAPLRTTRGHSYRA